MASALTSTCDVAVYEQGVWFLRLSAVLLLASFANYVTLPSKDKPLKTPAVAQVEEIQEAVAVPASEENSSIQQGADISAPPVPDTRTQKNKSSAGKVIQSGTRVKNTRKSLNTAAPKPIRRGFVRRRRRATSQEKPKTTSAGVVSGSTNIIQMASRKPPAAASRVQLGSVPVSRSKALVADPIVANRAVAARPPRSQSSAQEPITISMHPSKVKHLKFSL
jgi:hypothetical protein